MANTRIFEIAKQMGIKSKAIVEKCHAEGIPKDVIKNHMSTVSIGLEQTIREWFASTDNEDSPHTAVESTEKVDIEKVREKKPRKAKAKAVKAVDEDTDEPVGDTVVAVAAPPKPKATARAAAPAAATKPSMPAASAKPAAPALRPPHVPAGLSSTPPPSATRAVPAANVATPPVTNEPPRTVRPPKPEIKGPRAAPQMNVPTRPKIIAPAGRVLEKKSTIKLSGPKVIR
ncbi:MAG: translation initiation factor IF-2 N-terminal domain-containing protein, partial [Phycisphaerales bacterium]|nr:translation initiation factor IF-2 N-terminal domain-containing protein [Phycisphaerales bacterium]